jgi:hypothetical protein
MLSSHNLSISVLRGQGYDGTSNMRDEFIIRVQKLIRDENSYAFYVHCFANELLAVVTMSASSADIVDLFYYVPLIVNNVGCFLYEKGCLACKAS